MEYKSRKCHACGKLFTPLYPELWAYRVDKKWYCSWGCLRADESTPKPRKPYTHKEKLFVKINPHTLAWLMKEDGRPSHKISESIGRSKSYLYNLIERNRECMPEESAKKLAEVLNCDMALFVKGKGKRT